MSASDGFETSLLKLYFQAVEIVNVAQNTATSPITQHWISLHTADPGDAGSQTTSEATYTSYVRTAVTRGTTGWSVSGSSASPVANIDFASCTGSTNTISHFGIGRSSTGAGTLDISGTVTPNIAVSSGVIPRLTTATTVTCD